MVDAAQARQQAIQIATEWMRVNYAPTETRFAQALARQVEDGWLYDADARYWLKWSGVHWARYQTPQFMQLVGGYVSSIADMLLLGGHVTATERKKLHAASTFGAVEKICRTLPTMLARAGMFDTNPFLLNTPGGTVDLRNGMMQPANPADHITVLTPVTPADPGTPLGPRFRKFLSDITGNDDDFIKTLQQWFGIPASGTSRDQRILFLYGSGGNGKGVLLRTVAGCLGDYAVNAPHDLLMMEKYSRHATHLVDVVKARMAIATEVDDDATWDVALVKNLTGGDPISVNRMRQDPFRLEVRCTITISGNSKPALKGVDDAVKRRFLLGTFVLKVAEKDVIVDLEKEFIADEGPAIMRWIIDGAVAREAEGRLHIAQVLRTDTEDYFAEENVLVDFIDTYLERRPDAKTKTVDAYAAWKGYCAHAGRPVGARNSFTTAMRAAGIEYRRTEDGRYFLNVHLKLGTEGII